MIVTNMRHALTLARVNIDVLAKKDIQAMENSAQVGDKDSSSCHEGIQLIRKWKHVHFGLTTWIQLQANHIPSNACLKESILCFFFEHVIHYEIVFRN